MGKGDKQLQRAALSDRGQDNRFLGELDGLTNRLAQEWVDKAMAPIFVAACRVVCTEPAQRGPAVAELERVAQLADVGPVIDPLPVNEQGPAVRLLQKMYLGAPRSARRQIKTAFSAVACRGAVDSDASAAWCREGVAEMLAEGMEGKNRIALVARLFECPEAGIDALDAPEALATWLELLNGGLATSVERDAALKASAVTLRRLRFTLAEAAQRKHLRIVKALTKLAEHLPSVLRGAADPAVNDKETCSLAALVMTSCLAVGIDDDVSVARLIRSRLLTVEDDSVATLDTHAQPWTPAALAGSIPPMETVGLVRGVLSAAGKHVLLSELKAGDDFCVLLACFRCVCDVMATSVAVPVLNYYSRATFAFWLKTVLDLAKGSPDEMRQVIDLSLFRADEDEMSSVVHRTIEVVERVLQETWETWEHPVAEIRSMAKSNFETLLSIFQRQAKGRSRPGTIDSAPPSPHGSFVDHLAQSLMAMPWHIKGRYGPLCEVSRRVGALGMATRYPNVLDDVVRCLAVNMLSRCAAKLYTVLLQSLVGECKKSCKNALSSFEVWHDVFWKSLDESLRSDDERTRANCITYLVPATLSAFPEAAHFLVNFYLNTVQEPAQRDKGLRALIAVGKASRAAGILCGADLLDEVDGDASRSKTLIPMDLLLAALNHADPLLQMDALSLVVCDKRSTARVSTTEVNLVMGFLANNGCVVLSATRQRLMSVLRDFFRRLTFSLQTCKNAAAAADKQLEDMDKQGWSLKKMAPYVKKSEVLDHDFENAKSQFERVFNLVEEFCNVSLSPALSYPRVTTAIQIWQILVDTVKVERSAGDLSELFGRQKSARNARAVLGATMSSHSDVRRAASHLLSHSFTNPIVLMDTVDPHYEDGVSEIQQRAGAKGDKDDNAAFKEGSAKSIADVAGAASSILRSCWVTMSGFGTQDTEGGALLLASTIRHYVMEHGMVLRVSTDAFAKGDQPLCCAEQSADDRLKMRDPTLMTVGALGHLVEAILESTRKDIAGSSRSRTLVGIVSAMTSLWPLLRMRFESGCELWADFVENWFLTMCNVGTWALDLLAPNRDKAGCDSFADVDTTLESLSTVGDERSHPPLPGSDDAKEHILSLAWRTMASISDFFGGAFAHLPIGKEGGSIEIKGVSLLTVHQICEWFRAVLLGVRHRGVIESCSDGLENLCARLLTSSAPDVARIPIDILDTALDFVESSTSVSVTRRGAGIPHVIKSVLTNSRDASLSSSAMRRLLCTASKPFTSVDSEYDDLSDLPQVRAFNVLTALVSDGNAAERVQPFVADALIAAIIAFQSPQWAITNAAQITYSALVHRALGMKKVRQDGSRVNSITAREFFARFPPLKEFLYDRLDAAVTRQKTEPFLAYPLLTLLSRLATGTRDSTSPKDMELYTLLHDLANKIVVFVSNPVLQLRELASAAMIPMFSASAILSESVQWLQVVGGITHIGDPDLQRKKAVVVTEQGSVSANGLHGAILCAHEFARVVLPDLLRAIDAGMADEQDLEPFGEALSACAWLLSPKKNVCAILAVALVELLDDLLKFDITGTRLAPVIIPLATTLASTLPSMKYSIGSRWLQQVGMKLVFRALSTKGDADVGLLRSSCWKLLDHDSAEIRTLAMLSYHETVFSNPESHQKIAVDKQKLVTVCMSCILHALHGVVDSGLFCSSARVLETLMNEMEDDIELKASCAKKLIETLFSRGVHHSNIRVQEYSLKTLGHLLICFYRIQSCTLDEEQCKLFDLYIVLLDKFSLYTEAASLRLCSAQTLGASCRVLLNEPTFLGPTVRLIIRSLSDDDSDVREALARTVAAGIDLPFALQPYATIQALCNWLVKNSLRLGCVVVWHAIDEAMCRTCPSPDTCVADADLSLSLFTKEDDNVYVEPMWLTCMAGRTISCLVSRISCIKTAKELREVATGKARRLALHLVSALKQLAPIDGELTVRAGLYNPTNRADRVTVFILACLPRLLYLTKTVADCGRFIQANVHDDLPPWPGVEEDSSHMKEIPELEAIFALGSKVVAINGLPSTGNMMLSLLYDVVVGPNPLDGDFATAAGLIAMQLLISARTGDVKAAIPTPAPSRYHFPNPLPTGFPVIYTA